MVELVWSEKLEAAAQEHANKCVKTHSTDLDKHCKESKAEYFIVGPALEIYPESDTCDNPLGMADHVIPDSAITASSSIEEAVGPRFARLHNEERGGGWCPFGDIDKNTYEWLQIDLGRLTVVTAVATQGRYPWGNALGREFTKTYVLEYQREEGEAFMRWKDARTGKEVIAGNTDVHHVKHQRLGPPIIARRIRFVPYRRRVTVCLRVELYGCDACGSRPLLPNNGAYELGSTTWIVGGDQSTPFSWPSICGLTDTNGRHLCGGTLVKNSLFEFVFITAAHCLDRLGPLVGRYRAYCGQHDKRGDSPSHRQILRFSLVRIHQNYDKRTWNNDIAVLKFLTQPVENNYVQAACLADVDNFEGEKSIVVGWGTVAFGGLSPNKLRQVNKPIKSDRVCSQRLGDKYHMDNMMCAGYTTGGADSCSGDSGGPLYTLRNNAWTLTGVVSWGSGCAAAYSPGVYADVYQLRSWIDINIE